MWPAHAASAASGGAWVGPTRGACRMVARGGAGDRGMQVHWVPTDPRPGRGPGAGGPHRAHPGQHATGRHQALMDLPEQVRYQFLEGDILDPAALRRALEGGRGGGAPGGGGEDAVVLRSPGLDGAGESLGYGPAGRAMFGGRCHPFRLHQRRQRLRAGRPLRRNARLPAHGPLCLVQMASGAGGAGRGQPGLAAHGCCAWRRSLATPP